MEQFFQRIFMMRELYGDKYASLGHLLDDMIRVHMESKGDVYADWRGRMVYIANIGDGSRKRFLLAGNAPDGLVSYLESMRARYDGVEAKHGLIEQRISILDKGNRWRQGRGTMKPMEEVDLLADLGCSISMYMQELKRADLNDGQTTLIPNGSPRTPLLNPAEDDALLDRLNREATADILDGLKIYNDGMMAKMHDRIDEEMKG